MDTNKFDLESDDVAQDAAAAAARKKPTKSQNIAGLFSNKKTRNIILFTAGIIVIVIIIVGLSFSAANKTKEIPAAYKGVDAGQAPTSMKDDNLGKDSPRFGTIAKSVDSTNLAEAEKTGKSFEPAATNTYQFNPTQSAPAQAQPAPAAIGTPPPAQGYQQVQYQQPQPEEKWLQDMRQNASQAISRNIQLWDTTHGPKVINVELPARNVASATGQGTVNGNYGGGSTSQSGLASLTSRSAPVTLITSTTRNVILFNLPMNSAEPGDPAVATILTGDFKGSTLSGVYAKNDNNDTLVAKFDSMALKDYNVSVPVRAQSYNIDDATKQGIASSVDHHYLTKYVLQPSAAALAAIGNALGRPQTTVNIGSSSTVTSTNPITNSDAAAIGVGAAATQFQTDMNAQSTASTVVVNANAVAGVVFLQDVVYQKPDPNLVQQTQQQTQPQQVQPRMQVQPQAQAQSQPQPMPSQAQIQQAQATLQAAAQAQLGQVAAGQNLKSNSQ